MADMIKPCKCGQPPSIAHVTATIAELEQMEIGTAVETRYFDAVIVIDYNSYLRG